MGNINTYHFFTIPNTLAMYSIKIKNHLTRGTYKRAYNIYSNFEWGYDALDMIGVFRNMG